MQKKKKWIVIKVIDFHSHIIPSIDDGSRNVQETFKMIEEAKEVGFSKIISTSHYLNDLYEVDENDRKAIISAINSHNWSKIVGSVMAVFSYGYIITIQFPVFGRTGDNSMKQTFFQMTILLFQLMK